jgi:stalled ribosome alternative rescue factor ArfA
MINCGRGRDHNHIVNVQNSLFRQKRKNNKKGKNDGQSSMNYENICYRCGSKNHWSRTCRTPKHLVDLYQQSLKNKEKNHFALDDALEDV